MGERDGAIVIRVSAPPVDGRANGAVCRLIAERLGLPKSAVQVRVDGVSADQIRQRLLD